MGKDHGLADASLLEIQLLRQLHSFRDFHHALAEDGFSGQIFKYF